MDLLRFSTAGSVDDGKSTLIGRLLYDAKGVFDDQLDAVARVGERRGSEQLDLSLLTDGLRAEREQGITIDVAYRYFATPRRKFIIADTPGHEQYTRNMATGASTAELAVVLIDARHGVVSQSRRHTTIAVLLGIRHLVFAVNKMDLVAWSAERFAAIAAEVRALVEGLGGPEPVLLPLSALTGDNVVHRSEVMPWYRGPSLLETLESAPVGDQQKAGPLRFPVQLVLRPHLDYRGFAGRIERGTVRVGDELLALPAGTRSRVRQIDHYDGPMQQAQAPASVTLLLEDEIDVSRGDMLVPSDAMPWVRSSFDAQVVWMDTAPLDPQRAYLLKHTTRTVQARVVEVHDRLDVDAMKRVPADALELNAIGRLRIEVAQPLFLDPYASCRQTGAFILIDPVHNATVAAGMVEREQAAQGRASVLTRVDAAARAAQLGHRAGVVWLGGGSRDTRDQLAQALETRLVQRGVQALRWPAESEVDLGAGAALLACAGVLLIATEDDGPEPAASRDASHLQVVLAHAEADADRGSGPLQVDLREGVEAAARRVMLTLRDRGSIGSRRVVSPGAGI